jgi:hypothetical protein
MKGIMLHSNFAGSEIAGKKIGRGETFSSSAQKFSFLGVKNAPNKELYGGDTAVYKFQKSSMKGEIVISQKKCLFDTVSETYFRYSRNTVYFSAEELAEILSCPEFPDGEYEIELYTHCPSGYREDTVIKKRICSKGNDALRTYFVE